MAAYGPVYKVCVFLCLDQWLEPVWGAIPSSFVEIRLREIAQTQRFRIYDFKCFLLVPLDGPFQVPGGLSFYTTYIQISLGGWGGRSGQQIAAGSSRLLVHDSDHQIVAG